MAKFHIKPNGEPGNCIAQAGNCPLGADQKHYDSPDEAREAFEASQGSSFENKSADFKNETEFVIDFTTVEKLKEGDEFNGSPITRIKVGRKNVTLDTKLKKNQVVPIGEAASVFVEQPTARAKAAKSSEASQDYKERAIASNIKTAKESLETATNNIVEKIKKYGEASSFDYTNLINAQAQNKIWSRVESMAEKNNISQVEATDRLTAYYNKNWSDYQLKNAGLSRSTSILSNAIEAAEDEAIIKFVRDSNWRW